MVNGRITVEQMEWLQGRADALDGNLSAALRQTITDARFLELAREDYERLRRERPEFEIPRNDPPEADSRILQVILSMPTSEAEDLDLRREESGDAE